MSDRDDDDLIEPSSVNVERLVKGLKAAGISMEEAQAGLEAFTASFTRADLVAKVQQIQEGLGQEIKARDPSWGQW